MVDIMPAVYNDIASFTVVPDDACYGNQSGVVWCTRRPVLCGAFILVHYI